MRMIIIMVTLLYSFHIQAFNEVEGTGRSVYLVEKIQATNDIDIKGPFCVEDVNVSMPEWSTKHYVRGVDYSCNVQFTLSNGIPGSRSISYSARVAFYDVMRLGDKMASHFGFFGYFTAHSMAATGTVTSVATVLDTMVFAVPNTLVQGVYQGANFLNNLFERDPNKRIDELTPKFEDVFSSMQSACELIIFESKEAACNQEIYNRIATQIEKRQQFQDLYGRLIPRR